jgi:DNA-binding transcriptional regulator YiaG
MNAPEARYTDPPGMPDDERMTPAEFRVVREYLGLSGPWLASVLGVSDRTIRHWEAGRYPIPDGVRLAIEQIEQDAAASVEAGIKQLMDAPDPTVITYATDEQYHAAHPEITYPASWHRAVVARIAQEVPALRIEYAPADHGVSR